ncbi:MAG: methyltransferase [bacterium]
MTDFSSVSLGRFGDIYVPTELRGLLRYDTAVKRFEAGDLSGPSRIFDHVRRGGVAVLSGLWDEIVDLVRYAERKRSELDSKGKRGYSRLNGRRCGSALDRFAVLAHGDSILDVNPSIRIPHLLELLGDRAGSDCGLSFLVPVRTVVKLLEALERPYTIPSLGGEVVAHENVLPPRSRESVDLVGKALQYLKEGMPPNPYILDMGCGSGCLALLAAQTFADLGGRVVASDILPEAIATTKINIERFSSEGRLPPGAVEVANVGDLFDTIRDIRFDIIIFNAPWVVARPRSRADIATHDEGQRIVREFLVRAPRHLKGGGRIVLEYSDNSGRRAVESLERIIRDVGLREEKVFKARIQARRAGRRWETVFAFVLLSLDFHPQRIIL